jgi:hypothetical protein
VAWDGGKSTHADGVKDCALRCQNAGCRTVIGGLIAMGDGKTVVDYWPKHAAGKDFPDVPEHIAAAADEAHRCISIAAFRAAIATARTVVEATAKEHEVTNGNLEDKIDALVEKEVIDAGTGQAAHAVRLWGNDAAHGDLALSPVDGDDARAVVTLMDDVLLRAFQLPARTRRLIDSREARRSNARADDAVKA